MRFEDVHIAGLAHLLPERVVTSEALETELAPLYDRLRLRVGRLELMSGVRERRHAEPGTRPSELAAAAGRAALDDAGVRADEIGCLVHASVCRDFLEPATASVVHRALGLPASARAFDLSNACLGFVDALTVVGAMVDRGDIAYGLVVAGEDGGPLVRRTIEHLLGTEGIGKAELKRAFASLTIGSGAAAAVVSRRDGLRGGFGARLVGGATGADSSAVELCQGDTTEGGAPLMETDSEALLVAGCALAARTWPGLLDELDWSRERVDRVVTHQVGVAHRRALLAALELDPAIDFPTVEFLGNVGSVALPATLDLARRDGFVAAGQRVALLGIGSGLQCTMLGLET